MYEDGTPPPEGPAEPTAEELKQALGLTSEPVEVAPGDETAEPSDEDLAKALGIGQPLKRPVKSGRPPVFPVQQTPAPRPPAEPSRPTTANDNTASALDAIERELARPVVTPPAPPPVQYVVVRPGLDDALAAIVRGLWGALQELGSAFAALLSAVLQPPPPPVRPRIEPPVTPPITPAATTQAVAVVEPQTPPSAAALPVVTLEPEPEPPPEDAGLEPGVWAEVPPPETRALVAAEPVRAAPAIQPKRTPKPVMNLGTTRNEVQALNQMAVDRRNWLAFGGVTMTPDELIEQDLMPYDEYKYTVKNRSALVRELELQWRASLPAIHPDFKPYNKQHRLNPAQIHFLREPAHRHHTLDVEGYYWYLTRRHKPAVQKVLAEATKPSAFPEESRRMHTLIFGPWEWGKSELMKALMYHYAEDGSAAVVVLDPGGDLVKQVCRWPELVRENRLRIIQPDLDESAEFKGYTVGFNPLDGTGLGIEERRVVAADWAQTLGMIGAKDHDLTPTMTLLVTMCVQVLLTVPGATLEDLGHLLKERPPKPRGATERPEADTPRAAELQRLARNYEVAQVADFFRYDYDTDAVENTRRALRRRITMVLNYPHAEAMLTGKATIDLEAEIEARRFILVDLSRFKKIGSAAMGRLFVAQVAAIGRRRESQNRTDRTPTHLFIDEATTMVSGSMFEVFKELRKFGIYLTMAQQVGGDAMTPDQKEAIKLAGCKLIAPVDEAAKWISDFDATDMAELQKGEFFVSWAAPRNQPSIPLQQLRVRSDLADDKHAVPLAEWYEHQREITGEGGYYRRAEIRLTMPEAAPEDAPGKSQVQTPPRSVRGRRDSPRRPAPVSVPDDVPDELRDRYVSDKGREGNW